MPNKVYVNPETAITFADSAQSPDANLTMQNLAAGAGRVSAQYDRGAGAKPDEFAYRLTVQFETAPVVGQQVEIYIATSDGTDEDGQEGTADAALGSSDSLKNMRLAGIVVVTSTDASHDMTASGYIRLAERYVSMVVYNNTDDNLKDSATVNTLTLTPIPPEIQ